MRPVSEESHGMVQSKYIDSGLSSSQLGLGSGRRHRNLADLPIHALTRRSVVASHGSSECKPVGAGREARGRRGWGQMTSKARKGSSTEPIPQYTWKGFIAYAESFGQAAVYVSNGINLRHNAPVALACHCIELSLKAVLLKRGYTEEQVVAFRHNLNKLFNETRSADLDWSDLDTKAIAFYAQAVLEHAFRYRNSARSYMCSTTMTFSCSRERSLFGVRERWERGGR
jgi:hypothetical protein